VLHQVGYLFELNVKLQCQKVKITEILFLFIFNQPNKERQILTKVTDSKVTIICSDRAKLLHAEEWRDRLYWQDCLFIDKTVSLRIFCEHA